VYHCNFFGIVDSDALQLFLLRLKSWIQCLKGYELVWF